MQGSTLQSQSGVQGGVMQGSMLQSQSGVQGGVMQGSTLFAMQRPSRTAGPEHAMEAGSRLGARLEHVGLQPGCTA